MDDVLVQDHQTVVTAADRRRLRQMIDSLRGSLPTSGGPHRGYLRALEERLREIATVAEQEVGDDVVTMNSTVRICDDGRCQDVTLVYEPEADPFGEKVSVLTPLGTALLGSRVGDVVEWETRRGPRRQRIDRIVFQPEAAGKFHL